MKAGSWFLNRGVNSIGRGSLVWLLEGGKLELNGNSFTAGQNKLISKTKISIGKDCAIAWGVTICDHDFHKTYINNLPLPESSPIVIKDRVWIGMNATILKGVTIGEGAVVGAGSLVAKDVAAATMVAGNPAKVVRSSVDFRG